jgi:hypothetical protein
MRLISIIFAILSVAAFAGSAVLLASHDVLLDRQHGLLELIAAGVFANVAVTAAGNERPR